MADNNTEFKLSDNAIMIGNKSQAKQFSGLCAKHGLYSHIVKTEKYPIYMTFKVSSLGAFAIALSCKDLFGGSNGVYEVITFKDFVDLLSRNSK